MQFGDQDVYKLYVLYNIEAMDNNKCCSSEIAWEFQKRIKR